MTGDDAQAIADIRRRQAEYIRTRRKMLRDAWIAENGPCVQCGSTDRLEVDHIDPCSKDPKLRRNGLSNMWAWSEVRRAAELAKCQVLCHTCHSEKSRTESDNRVQPLRHGTIYAYRVGCRCPICKAVKSHYAREQRRKSKERKENESGDNELAEHDDPDWFHRKAG